MTMCSKQLTRGFTLVELLVVIIIIVILAAIAVPSLLAYRRSANEGSAVATLRTLHGGEMTYQASTEGGAFAGSLSLLASEKIIDSVLGSGLKNGYAFSGGKLDATPEAPATFFYSAIPLKSEGIDRTGSRRFGIATDGVIRYSESNLGTHFADLNEVTSAPAFSTK